MKINKKIHKQLVKNLDEWKKDIIKDIEDQLGNIKKCNTSVEDLMVFKADLIITVLTSLPVAPDQCYFCLKQGDQYKFLKCETCVYGKFNGNCPDDSSSFHKLHEKTREVIMDYCEIYPKFNGEVKNENK